MKKVLLLVMSALSIGMAGAQTWSGRIVDERGEAVAFANVVLLGRDSTFLDGNVSDQEGAFRIEEKPGESWLRISYIGYKDLFLPLEGEGRDLGAISLRTEEMALDEVVVRGTLPVTRLKGDALVTSVENSMLAEVGSANDVLAKIPGLTRGEEGFEVFGKGEPLIYINGRKLRDKEELERLSKMRAALEGTADDRERPGQSSSHLFPRTASPHDLINKQPARAFIERAIYAFAGGCCLGALLVAFRRRLKNLASFQGPRRLHCPHFLNRVTTRLSQKI